MVRLLPWDKLLADVAAAFQFLNGTIITRVRAKKKPNLHVVSIPQWYDYYLKLTSDIYVIDVFQFLNGTIITECR